MDQFNVEKQYKLYLERVHLKEEDMHPIQRTETKRAFFGAWGALLILLRDDLAVFPEEDGADILQQMYDQTADFWFKEADRKN